MLDPSNVVALHVELTSVCNLNCPHCARTNSKTGTTIDSLPQSHLDPKTFSKVLEQLPNLQLLHFCGNYGDIVAYPDLFKIIEIIKLHNIPKVRFYTNGSARNVAFWKKFAEETTGFGEVIFSIDGLEDTNHIYRKGSSWDKIIKNLSSFVNGGGNATWEMLAFSHNEHQILEAKALADSFGVADFRIKKANRFNLTENSTVVETKIDMLKYKIKKSDFITCKYKEIQWLYLSFQGELFPCCWIGGSKFRQNQSSNNFYKEYLGYKSGMLDTNTNSILDILKNNFYRDLEVSWTSNPNDVCKKHCGNTNTILEKYIPIIQLSEPG
jgi:MoaA/NifB/PqqE/SkfB family radical SAM enzyme